MKPLDWVVLVATQLFIVAYGVWKSRGSKDIKSYLLSDKELRWFTIGLSIMATQASAITFLSTPGQAYGDGMRFVQFYFGLPLAMIILSAVAVPIYHKLNVYTAYEYLENRFDLKTRALGAFLFLTQRSLAAGLTIYAPAIILSKVLGWETSYLTIIIGFIVIIYTVSGGTKAVSYTQKQQMFVILVGMVIAGYMLFNAFPESIDMGKAMHVAGKMGRLEIIDFDFDFNSRYNVWSGLLGGLFLFLAYFGTDQSQVQRYLGGKSIAESRLGLILNGIIKVPMQFLILFVGVLLFVFYQYTEPPIYFNTAEKDLVYQTDNADKFRSLEETYSQNFVEKRETIDELVLAIEQGEDAKVDQVKNELDKLQEREKEIRTDAVKLIKSEDGTEISESELNTALAKDRDYVFITFVINYLPAGIVGLLIAVILSAAMSSASSELNALATTSLIDVYKRLIKTEGSRLHYLTASRALTLGWGLFAIGFAQFADRLENLIQAVNILGSLAYGTVLGIFMVAFFFKKVKGNAVFLAAIVAELMVIYCFLFTEMPYLWYNVVGCLPVIILGLIFQSTMFNKPKLEAN